MAASSTNSITSIIQHYQRSIEQSQDQHPRLLHCIGKLYKLPVKVEHLQETGIGKSVNALRKFDGEVGVAAVALVTKWKAMVAAEEEPMETNNKEDESNDDANDYGDDENENDDNKLNNTAATHESERMPDHHREEERNHRDTSSKRHSSKEHKHHSNGKRDKKLESVDGGSSSSSSKKHSNHHDKSSSHTSSSSKHKVNGGDDSRHMDEKGSERVEKYQHKSNEHQKSLKKTNVDNKDKEKVCDRTYERHSEHKEKRSSDKHRDEQHQHKSSASSSDQSSNAKRKERHNGDDLMTQDKSEHLQMEKEKHHERGKHSSSKEKDKEHKDKVRERSTDYKKAKHENRESQINKVSKENEHRDKHTASPFSTATSPQQPSTSANAAAAIAASVEHKRQRNPENDTLQSSKPKIRKILKDNVEDNGNGNDNDADDGIDSSMGANFADVLGMLNVPTKKSKKSLNSLKTQSPGTNAGKSDGNSKRSSSSSTTTSPKESPNKSNGPKKEYRKPPSNTLDKKPDLLSATAKLEPLDASIALALPTISNNYKPMPLNQTVMDCVFNTSASSSKVAPVRTLTDAEALSHGISSKTMRTKIYSGTRTGQIYQVPSLFDICIRILQKNIDALEYTGGVPFDVLRSVLERATPHQLLTFENYNPYVMEDSDCLWKLHCQRNYRTQKRQEMESWREMYLRCQEDQERKLNILAESIKQSQKVIAAPVRKTQLAFVDSMVKPPRNVLRKQEQFGTKAKLVATPAARVLSLSGVIPNAAKTGDARLRVAATVRDAAQVSHASVRPKKAPLMAKTLQFMRGRNKR